MKIWTVGKAPPFQMGGYPQFPLVTEITEGIEGPFEIGKGFTAFVITAPNGRTFVAEATSGAIVGDTLTMVRNDMQDAHQPQEQVNAAMRWREANDHCKQEVDAEEFWKRMRCNKL